MNSPQKENNFVRRTRNYNVGAAIDKKRIDFPQAPLEFIRREIFLIAWSVRQNVFAFAIRNVCNSCHAVRNKIMGIVSGITFNIVWYRCLKGTLLYRAILKCDWPKVDLPRTCTRSLRQIIAIGLLLTEIVRDQNLVSSEPLTMQGELKGDLQAPLERVTYNVQYQIVVRLTWVNQNNKHQWNDLSLLFFFI